MVERCQRHAFSYLRASSTIASQPKILMRSGKTPAISVNIVSIVSIIEKSVGWPTQQEWVAWTRSFDWLSVAVGFIRELLDARGT